MLEQFGGLELKLQALFNLATCPNYSITNYDKIPLSHYFEKVNKGHLKMLTYKNGQIFLYYRFNKTIKGPGTSFQSPTLNQRHIRNVCHTTHYYLMKFHFDSA